MSKPDLTKYSDKEIIASLLSLPASKFMPVMTGLGAIVEKMNRRGAAIARDNSDEAIDEAIRKLLENE